MSEASPALLSWAAGELPGATARLDAEVLLAHVLGMDRLSMLATPVAVADRKLAEFRSLLARRRTGEPIAYLVGHREFWSLDLAVTPDVLIPRPDSETLIEAAIAHFAGRAPARILDLGTGSGALLLAALSCWPEAWGVGVDCSPAALTVARANAVALGMGGRSAFLAGDWASALSARFDLVLANPPYVALCADLPAEVRDHEPHLALYAGADGLDAHRRLIPMLPDLLGPGAVAIVEVGRGQAAAIAQLAGEAGLNCRFWADLAGVPRAACLVAGGKGLARRHRADK